MKRALVLCLAAGCASSPGGPGSGSGSGSETGSGSGTEQNPQPDPNAPYKVATTVDLTIEALLPQQAELVVQTLRAFSVNPAKTLIEVAQEEGIPAIATIYNDLPGALTDPLTGWINDEINKIVIDGKPITVWAGDLADMAELTLTQFNVDSTLALDGATATHTLTLIDFSPTGLNYQVPITGIAAELLTQNPPFTVGANGAIKLGLQGFGLNIGDFAWDGLELATTDLFGGDIDTVLQNAINCPHLAQDVAGKCVLGVCVGHESDLQSFCTGAIDSVVNGVHAEFQRYNLDVLQYLSGTATLVDTNGDGVADQIQNGSWVAYMNLGLGPRLAPATFTGSR